jgi:hypothetical protein
VVSEIAVYGCSNVLQIGRKSQWVRQPNYGNFSTHAKAGTGRLLCYMIDITSTLIEWQDLINIACEIV